MIPVMKPLTAEIEIDLPRERVVELFDNPDNLCKWVPRLQSAEHLSSEPRQPGAKLKMVYQAGWNRVEVIETITERSLPDEQRSTWESAYSEPFMLKLMGLFFAVFAAFTVMAVLTSLAIAALVSVSVLMAFFLFPDKSPKQNVLGLLRNRFIELGPERTKWEITWSFQPDSTMLTLIGSLSRKRALRGLQNFKAFAEEGRDARHTA